MSQTKEKAPAYVEHKIADYFKSKEDIKAKTLRIFSTWAIEVVFPVNIHFMGLLHSSKLS